MFKFIHFNFLCWRNFWPLFSFLNYFFFFLFHFLRFTKPIFLFHKMISKKNCKNSINFTVKEKKKRNFTARKLHTEGKTIVTEKKYVEKEVKPTAQTNFHRIQFLNTVFDYCCCCYLKLTITLKTELEKWDMGYCWE